MYKTLPVNEYWEIVIEKKPKGRYKIYLGCTCMDLNKSTNHGPPPKGANEKALILEKILNSTF